MSAHLTNLFPIIQLASTAQLRERLLEDLKSQAEQILKAYETILSPANAFLNEYETNLKSFIGAKEYVQWLSGDDLVARVAMDPKDVPGFLRNYLKQPTLSLPVRKSFIVIKERSHIPLADARSKLGPVLDTVKKIEKKYPAKEIIGGFDLELGKTTLYEYDSKTGQLNAFRED